MTQPAVAPRRRSILRQMAKHRQVYVILLPVLLFYLIFNYGPMFGNVIAFQRYSITRGILKSPFVGLAHFRSFLKNYTFWRLLRNTVMINLYGLIFGFPAPIILALLLNELRGARFKRTVQTLTYMPYFISTVVVSGLMVDFLSTRGMINEIVKIFGGQPVQFLVRPELFWGVYTASEVWQGVGWGSIIYLSALSGIDQELYEASAIDGANRAGRLWHVTLPGILGTIMIMLILRIGQMLSLGYEKILLIYSTTVYSTADVISTYVYRKGLLDQDFSYSTAVGLFNSVVNFVLLLSANKLSRSATGGGLW
ncbi:MAG: ABC transporter permease subunit [Oscillospiraceae bacterium]|jgi:putative aldouronate transport system permease protein|nr:ABC transporter permease subunit [Oscillospiraceae bacterium]